MESGPHDSDPGMQARETEKGAERMPWPLVSRSGIHPGPRLQKLPKPPFPVSLSIRRGSLASAGRMSFLAFRATREACRNQSRQSLRPRWASAPPPETVSPSLGPWTLGKRSAKCPGRLSILEGGESEGDARKERSQAANEGVKPSLPL